MLVALFSKLHPGIHFSGDGALKERMIRQWLAEGNISAELRWDGAPEWAREFWKKTGRGPVGAPFVHEGKLVFPPLFMLASAPFYAAAGYRGLLAIPALSLLGIWIVAWRWMAARGLGGWPASAGMAALVFSPLTFYGALFWEHAPGVFCWVAAIALAGGGLGRGGEEGGKGVGGGGAEKEKEKDNEKEKDGRRGEPSANWKMIAGGAMGALAIALRAELAPAVAIAFALAAWKGATREGAIGSAGGGAGGGARGFAKAVGAWIGGAVAVGIGVAVLNKVSSGAWLGIHHEQPRAVELDGSKFIGTYWGGAARDYGLYLKGIAFAVVASLAGARAWWRREPERLALALVLPALLLALPLAVPNDGGQQIFRRYELAAIPAGALLAASLVRERKWMGWVLLALTALDFPWRLDDWRQFDWAHGRRAVPAFEAITELRPKAILVSDTGAAAELSAWPTDAPILRSENNDQAGEAVAAAERAAGLENSALVLYLMKPRKEIAIRVKGGGAYLARAEGIGGESGKDEGNRYYYYRIEKAGGQRARN